jgi:4-hydroxy-3-methylbut-2-enyl diphosphate reductase
MFFEKELGAATVEVHQAEFNIPHNPDIIVQEPGVDKVLIGLPYGYCGGVRMALEGTLSARRAHPNVNVVTNHPPVHNDDAIKPLKEAGIDLTGSINMEAGDVLVFSAHGSDPRLRNEAKEKGLTVYDATCPLVTKTHQEIELAAESDTAIVYISFSDSTHPEATAARAVAEINGIHFMYLRGEDDIDEALKFERITIIGQTTNDTVRSNSLAQKLQESAKRYGNKIVTPYNPRDVCQTIRDRMFAAAKLVKDGSDAIVVVGSVTSQNTREIAELAKHAADTMDSFGKLKKPTQIYVVNSWEQLPELSGTVGIVSGASTPPENVEGVALRLNPAMPVEYVGEDSDRARTFMPTDPKLRKVMEAAREARASL